MAQNESKYFCHIHKKMSLNYFKKKKKKFPRGWRDGWLSSQELSAQTKDQGPISSNLTQQIKSVFNSSSRKSNALFWSSRE